MRKLLISAIVSSYFAVLSVAAFAQQASPSANASRFGIAVVDVSYIFKKYDRFRTQMEGMKKEMEAAEGKLKAERDSIQGKEEEAKQYRPSSPEFKALDEELARRKAEFNLQAGKIRKEFLEREAKVYYQTYLEVSQAVRYYAQQQNIGLVLRFNGDQINPDHREDVLRAINKPVVHQNNIDITPDVLRVLNRGSAPGGVPPVAGKRQPPRG